LQFQIKQAATSVVQGKKMPKTFPTQLLGYLKYNFRSKQFTHHDAAVKIGALRGFLDLYRELPHELIRLPPDEYAALVAAVGDIRFAMDQFQATPKSEWLSGVPGALSTVWTLIEKLPDSIPSSSHDLTFIADPVFQEMIGRDVSAVTTDLHSGEWKGATIIAGSCCEALLLYGLQTRDAKTPGTISGAAGAIHWNNNKQPNASDLTHRSWDLFSYTTVAHYLKLICDGTKDELGPARDYRNLIHPAKTMREKVQCDQGTAHVAFGALVHVISDLRKNL
jgi:hypothetical protein